MPVIGYDGGPDVFDVETEVTFISRLHTEYEKYEAFWLEFLSDSLDEGEEITEEVVGEEPYRRWQEAVAGSKALASCKVNSYTYRRKIRELRKQRLDLESKHLSLVSLGEKTAARKKAEEIKAVDKDIDKFTMHVARYLFRAQSLYVSTYGASQRKPIREMMI